MRLFLEFRIVYLVLIFNFWATSDDTHHDAQVGSSNNGNDLNLTSAHFDMHYYHYFL